jgi:diguanylate cyclase (GGDEF)-like protein
MANLVSSAILISALLLLRRKKNGVFFYRIITLFFIIIFPLIIIEGREEISYFIWVMIFPAAVFSVLGKRDGAIASSIFFVLSIFFMMAPQSLIGSEPYSGFIVIRFLLASMAITFIIYNYESSQQLLFQYMKKERDKFETASKYDPLTKLSNRRDIREKIKNEQERQKRLSKPFSVILCDIDDFKKMNDTHGHDCGDYVLMSVSDLIRSQLRDVDCPSRWGGEEFLILLVETDLEGCKIVAERIRKRIESALLQYGGVRLSITMTFGISACGNSEEDIERCIKRADRALYKGKRQGKNCVVAAGDE